MAPTAARVCQVTGAYNVQLAIQRLHDDNDCPLPERIVANDIEMGENGRIAILTGPNQGGKTTYMQSVGQVQVLAQLGLPIPGTAGRISPVDAIFTHYPTEEQLERGTGRFGDEARRIRAIFEKVTPATLLLLNESLASTHPGESLYLARDIVRALRQIGLRALFTTHLHDLAAAAEAINATTPGDSDVLSLVASPIESPFETKPRYSYQVRAMPPAGRSYAENIATRYGISGDQLHDLPAARNLLPDQE